VDRPQAQRVGATKNGWRGVQRLDSRPDLSLFLLFFFFFFFPGPRKTRSETQTQKKQTNKETQGKERMGWPALTDSRTMRSRQAGRQEDTGKKNDDSREERIEDGCSG
jgi:hypothetical protein